MFRPLRSVLTKLIFPCLTLSLLSQIISSIALLVIIPPGALDRVIFINVDPWTQNNAIVIGASLLTFEIVELEGHPRLRVSVVSPTLQPSHGDRAVVHPAALDTVLERAVHGRAAGGLVRLVAAPTH